MDSNVINLRHTAMYFADKLILLFSTCFQQFHQTKFVAYCLIIFCSSLTFYYLLLAINKSEMKFVSLKLRKFFFISAHKSESNAIQVGGIPFALLSMLSTFILFSWFPYLIDQDQSKILFYALFSWIGILIYGYIDDYFEIRPIVKLFSQFILASIFCINSATILFPLHSAYAFVVMLLLAVGVLNGTNLMDGLDTLSYKISSVIYFSFIVLSAPVLNLPAFFIAVSCFFIMSGFYFFNREPSKIHLGEVGVSCLGFSYIILSVLTLNSYKNYNPFLLASSKALLPLVFPLVEITISFIRRILNGKSPFKGDKLHVHHILHEVFNFSASHSSSIIAASYFIMITLSLMLMDPFTSIVSFIVLIVLSFSWSLLLGYKHWFKNQVRISIFNSLLVKKDVNIISSNALSDFRIVIDKKSNLKK